MNPNNKQSPGELVTELIAHDWRGEQIYSDDGDRYFSTEYGFVLDPEDESDLCRFMAKHYGESMQTYHMYESWLKGEL